MYSYRPRGVCSRLINFDIENGIVKNVEIVGGCAGNSAGVAKLANNRPATEVIALLKGIPCRSNTSCPDQLAIAIEQALQEK